MPVNEQIDQDRPRRVDDGETTYDSDPEQTTSPVCTMERILAMAMTKKKNSGRTELVSLVCPLDRLLLRTWSTEEKENHGLVSFMWTGTKQGTNKRTFHASSKSIGRMT